MICLADKEFSVPYQWCWRRGVITWMCVNVTSRAIVPALASNAILYSRDVPCGTLWGMSPTDESLETWLRAYIQRNGGVAGTLHVKGSEQLELKAAVNIPPKVMEIVRTIPKGKGMAGLAWERDDAVHTCNLKSDDSGDVRPGAKAVDANAAVAIPIHDASGQIRGVVGIAYMGEREITQAELDSLRSQAEQVEN
jgi:L-methionine (R)-S-oxide reductase